MESRIKDNSRKKKGECGDDERGKEWFLKVGQAGDPQVGAVSPTTPPHPSSWSIQIVLESSLPIATTAVSRKLDWDGANSSFPLSVTPIRKG